MPLTAPTPVLLSPDAYFEWDEAQQVKHEYIHGEVFAMPGGTRAHALITSNLIFALRLALRGMDCRVYPESLRVQVEDGARYTYPDISVVCGEELYVDDRQTTLVNLSAVVEVLSGSTAAYDRGEKAAAYRQIASLQAIVLVEQEREAAELYTRDADGRWTSREVWADERIGLAPLGVEIAMADLYAGV